MREFDLGGLDESSEIRDSDQEIVNSPPQQPDHGLSPKPSTTSRDTSPTGSIKSKHHDLSCVKKRRKKPRNIYVTPQKQRLLRLKQKEREENKKKVGLPDAMTGDDIDYSSASLESINNAFEEDFGRMLRGEAVEDIQTPANPLDVAVDLLLGTALRGITLDKVVTEEANINGIDVSAEGGGGAADDNPLSVEREGSIPLRAEREGSITGGDALRVERERSVVDHDTPRAEMERSVDDDPLRVGGGDITSGGPPRVEMKRSVADGGPIRVEREGSVVDDTLRAEGDLSPVLLGAKESSLDTPIGSGEKFNGGSPSCQLLAEAEKDSEKHDHVSEEEAADIDPSPEAQRIVPLTEESVVRISIEETQSPRRSASIISAASGGSQFRPKSPEAGPPRLEILNDPDAHVSRLLERRLSFGPDYKLQEHIARGLDGVPNHKEDGNEDMVMVDFHQLGPFHSGCLSYAV